MTRQSLPGQSGHKPVHRRGFLQIGTLGLAGLALPQLLKAEASAGIRSSHKSVILIHLVGGPPHQDMFDLKPHAPKEIAGPWKPRATNVTGVQICEAFPRLAQIMDKLIGATDRIAGEAVARPVTFGELYATLYHNLGIDVSRTTIQDLAARPQYLVEDHAKALREVC